METISVSIAMFWVIPAFVVGMAIAWFWASDIYSTKRENAESKLLEQLSELDDAMLGIADDSDFSELFSIFKEYILYSLTELMDYMKVTPTSSSDEQEKYNLYRNHFRHLNDDSLKNIMELLLKKARIGRHPAEMKLLMELPMFYKARIVTNLETNFRYYSEKASELPLNKMQATSEAKPTAAPATIEEKE